MTVYLWSVPSASSNSAISNSVGSSRRTGGMQEKERISSCSQRMLSTSQALAPKECYQQAELLLPKNATNKLSSCSQRMLSTSRALTPKLIHWQINTHCTPWNQCSYWSTEHQYRYITTLSVIILGTRLVAQSIMVLNTQQESLLRHPA